jgi:lipoate-protein ligase A
MAELRVIDAGTVDAVRSQSLWHGIATAMPTDAAPTLSFCRSATPYVCIGFHRALDEVDLTACGNLGLPVIRRQLGGGPVYIDSDQLFFQLTLPAAQAPARIDRLYQRFLGPAVTAFRALGLDAELRGVNDIAVGERKISGTGAGQLGEAVTVVGNVIFRFPHRRMAAILALPRAARAEYEILMERYVSSLAGEGLPAVDETAAKRALVDAYGSALELTPRPGSLTAAEEAAIGEWDARLTDGKWLAGRPPAGGPKPLRQVKINTDVWLVIAGADDLEVQATVVGREFVQASVRSPRLNGDGTALARALVGTAAHEAAIRACLEPFGTSGRRLAELLGPGLTLQ